MAELQNRKPTRLSGFNYANSGGYFITLVTHERKKIFGNIVNGEMVTNAIGRIVSDEWVRSVEIRPEIELDHWCVMPNHFHAIIIMKESYSHPQGGTFQRTPDSLGSIVAGFKGSVTRKVNEINGSHGFPVWQRNYYDHIIRDDEDLNRIREYIINNPSKWELDKEYLV
jgi:REP element-mobilizing transposase RayT